MKRVGVLGGTFDPIHIGHLIAASEAHSQLNLTEVLFVPAGNPWQKAGQSISSAEQRLAMVQLAIAKDERFSVSDIEVRRAGPSYAIETYEELTAQNPDSEFIWILGADVLSRIDTWHRWQEFVARVPIAVVNRQSSSSELVIDHQVVDIPEVGISATQLRRRYSAGDTAKYLVPDAVDDYIRINKLYQTLES